MGWRIDPQEVVITATGTWVVPADVEGVIVQEWGGSGGGGAGDTMQGGAGPGGPGGPSGYGAGPVATNPGEALNVDIGAAGQGGVYAPGTDGGTTQIRRGSTVLMSATGGKGGGSGGGGGIPGAAGTSSAPENGGLTVGLLPGGAGGNIGSSGQNGKPGQLIIRYWQHVFA